MTNQSVAIARLAAQIMRRILVNRALARACLKRGGGPVRVHLEEIPDLSSQRDQELVDLDEVLDRLALLDPRKAGVIELRLHIMVRVP